MDLRAFYVLMAATSFTLVGLWWTVIQKHPDWKSSPRQRALAGGTYLSFLLPGLMATLAQVAPGTPALWRISFGAAALVGLWSTVRLLRTDKAGSRGPFRRHRWVVTLIYLAILVLGVAPELARRAGLAPLAVGGVLLVLLIVLAHGLTWEFMMEPDEPVDAAPTPPSPTPGPDR
ncbi:hypothetical protein [Raineyella fluvialis]|uniref:hypothetical protein n=1 Tax=Raineyella fluvialis TaxID=2662261 RepID=UPI00188F89EC|nr:hypothetical protein [Raineyella fluvialis]